ncbi:IS5 family transposase [Streptomyces sp. NBC_01725]|uniref:IS5 family transposase n=1 Tax=Streptomyces sp. NBC_01725 TaxID=2975923 RepID=UPI002E28D466|nr:IS5 family transposase [Streptomyces sp. NBC_01725]
MRADLTKRLAPDELWELVAPLLPSFAARPQGGGTAPRDERAVFTAVAYILTSGCAWRYLPESFNVSPATAHRRFSVWTEAGLWRGLHRAVLDELGARGLLDWSSAIVDAASVRAKKGGLADRSESSDHDPADRGKKGSKLHVLSEGQGLPPVVAVSGANRPSPGPLIDRRYDVNADMGPTAAAEQRAAAGRAPVRAGNLR